MRKLITFVLFAFGMNVAFAASYQEAMIENIEKMNKTQNPVELVEIANAFDRIAQKETSEWLPLYYSAYANTSTLFFSPQLSSEEKTKTLDKAQQKIDEALKIAANESEIYVLQAMVYQMRISGDMNTAYQYTQKIEEVLARAEKLNPQNPRIPYLRGTTLFYTPAQYGGGPSAAKSLLEKAARLFSTADTSNALMPNWGAYHNNMVLQQCQ